MLISIYENSQPSPRRVASPPKLTCRCVLRQSSKTFSSSAGVCAGVSNVRQQTWKLVEMCLRQTARLPIYMTAVSPHSGLLQKSSTAPPLQVHRIWVGELQKGFEISAHRAIRISLYEHTFGLNLYGAFPAHPVREEDAPVWYRMNNTKLLRG